MTISYGDGEPNAAWSAIRRESLGVCRPFNRESFPQSGFTLLELCVVLVIIGFLAGGVLVGSSLLRASQLHAVIGDIDRYRQAINTFEDKFGSLPGDLPDAESYWGSDVSCPGTSSNTIAKAATCNGDGDGRIGVYNSPGSTQEYEMFRAWQQLVDAGLIPGAFTGVAGSDGPEEHLAGVNCPETQLTNGGFIILTLGILTGDPAHFDGDYGHSLGVGRERRPFGPDSPLFTPAEALSIDAKFDDGQPGTGRVRTFKNSVTPGCTTSDDPGVATYDTSTDDVKCSLKINTSH